MSHPLETSDDWGVIGTAAGHEIYIDPSGDPIAQAIAILAMRRIYYSFFRSYHRGIHRLLFQTSKFKSLFGRLFAGFADNLLPVVIDTYADRLRVDHFDVLEGPASLTKDLSTVWSRERFDQIAAQLHQEALICGDSYAIVWPEKDDGDEGSLAVPSVYPQRAEDCLVAHDPDAPDEIVWAVKIWRSADRFRLNVYYPDRIEKYETAAAIGTGEPFYPTTANQFRPVLGEEVVPNPWGVVPVFHFANNAWSGCFGESELRPLIALQDALNKSVVDMLVGFEFMALPQRFATGVTVEYDEQGIPKSPWQPGIDRVWIAEHPEAKFGQFEPAALGGFIEVQEAFRREIARISGIPMYYLLQTGQFPSGDALRMAESRLISRCERKQDSFGNSWEDLMEFYVRLAGRGETVLSAAWKYPAPIDPSRTMETLIQKQQIGVDRRTLLLEAGYGESAVDLMLEEADAQAANLADVMQTKFDSGRLN